MLMGACDPMFWGLRSDVFGAPNSGLQAAAITSSGAAIPRLGVPVLSAAEDTHGVVDGCIDASLLPGGTNSTGCPTTFPNGPGMGATFDRSLWTEIGTPLSGLISTVSTVFELDLRGQTRPWGVAMSCLRLKWADMVLI